MADILVVPMKKTSEVDLVKPLKNVIERFSADNLKNFDGAIGELNKLRSLDVLELLTKMSQHLRLLQGELQNFYF